MKKILGLIIIVLSTFSLITITKAATDVSIYKTETLKEACESDGIKFDHPTYKENEEKINIYIFRGDGCSYCHSLLTYLESIVDEYGQYFNVISFEVWNNSDNSKLMDEVAKYFEDTKIGVPYTIIGDKSFIGYASSMNNEIIDAIMKLYESKDRFDVFEHIGEDSVKTSSDTSNGTMITIIVVGLIGTVAILMQNHFNKKEILTKLEEFEIEFKKVSKKNQKQSNN